MNFIQPIKKKFIPLAALMLTAFSAVAQDASQPKAEEKSNLLAILLIVTAVVLAFVIWGMGQALVSVSRQVMLKQKAGGKALSAILLIGFSLLSKITLAQDAAAKAADAPNYGGLTANNFYAFVGVITIEVAAIVFLALSIRRVYQELLPEKDPAAVHESALGSWWSNLDKKFFTKAVAVEKEADVLLDHDYDGIKELDNSLPPWWKYGFIFTIIVAFIYLYMFQVSGAGKNPTEEYAAEMEKARIEKEVYDANNKDRVDEKNVPMADAAGIKAGQTLFAANCVACHLADGGGSVGPNLTDDYWLHKGSLNDIFHTITYGYPDKGMQSWKSNFTPKQISQLASYVKSLQGTKPAVAKAPQGELYTDVKTDSIPAGGPKVDSSVVKKTDTVTAAKAK